MKALCLGYTKIPMTFSKIHKNIDFSTFYYNYFSLNRFWISASIDIFPSPKSTVRTFGLSIFHKNHWLVLDCMSKTSQHAFDPVQDFRAQIKKRRFEKLTELLIFILIFIYAIWSLIMISHSSSRFFQKVKRGAGKALSAYEPSLRNMHNFISFVKVPDNILNSLEGLFAMF